MSIKNLIVLFVAMMLGITTLIGQEKGTKKSSKAKKSKPQTVSFKNDVFPIIKMYCMSCHAEEKMSPSELDMDTYDQIMKGGKHGPAIIPGHADSSLIIKKLGLTPPFGDPMPMKRKEPFSDDTLKIIKKWIDQGAKDN